jgi:hypothetical protein
MVRVVRGVARRVKKGREKYAPVALMRQTWDLADSHHLLVRDPVFLFSSVRSGSTLLRVILDSHSQIVAPLEMHFRSVRVRYTNRETKKAFAELGIPPQTMENMLWDRMFAQLLVDSGKSVVVDKTPSNTMAWRRISDWWPDARFLILLRHPVHIADSLIASRRDIPLEKHYQRVNSYVTALDAARKGLPGSHVVRYEDLTADPDRELRQICAWLGVAYEPEMINYTAQERSYVRGLGDWSPTIRSGEIRPPREAPAVEDIPVELRDGAALLGYI